MPNLLDEPHLFEKGEKIAYSIKYHGTNARFCYLRPPLTPQKGFKLFVGTHRTVIEENSRNLYWTAVKNMLRKEERWDKLRMMSDLVQAEKSSHEDIGIQKGLIFYGEIYGPGVQKGFHYGLQKPELIIFAIKRQYDYVGYDEFKSLCDFLSFPTVEHHELIFESVDQLREIADNTKGITDAHMNEGIVIISRERPGVMAKILSFNYLMLKDRTERH